MGLILRQKACVRPLLADGSELVGLGGDRNVSSTHAMRMMALLWCGVVWGGVGWGGVGWGRGEVSCRTYVYELITGACSQQPVIFCKEGGG
jgi:hypothetical protein